MRHDDDDPYLVVAADKGTATFSDIANGIAESRGFWLGDAFASGGSHGYDHKKMGITAKGAWVAVQRHFREMGRDIQKEPFTCIGIGDMSGDVFGNGMLLSEQTKLLAAFDHRHIFIDPDPDPAASWAERKRLFDLPRSSWEDYDKIADFQGRRRVRAQPEGNPAVAAAAEAHWAFRREGCACGSDEGAAEGGCRSALVRRHRHLHQGGEPRPISRSATAPTMRSASTAQRCGPR